MFGQLLPNKNKIATVRVYGILQTLPLQTFVSKQAQKQKSTTVSKK
jgi:hypothetical protein